MRHWYNEFITGVTCKYSIRNLIRRSKKFYGRSITVRESSPQLIIALTQLIKMYHHRRKRKSDTILNCSKDLNQWKSIPMWDLYECNICQKKKRRCILMTRMKMWRLMRMIKAVRISLSHPTFGNTNKQCVMELRMWWTRRRKKNGKYRWNSIHNHTITTHKRRRRNTQTWTSWNPSSEVTTGIRKRAIIILLSMKIQYLRIISQITWKKHKKKSMNTSILSSLRQSDGSTGSQFSWLTS